MALVRAIVTRAFWLAGETRPVGSTLELDDRLFAELHGLGKVAFDTAPAPAPDVEKPKARKGKAE